MRDELLNPFVDARSEREAQRLLDRLSETYLRPLIRSLVRHTLSKENDDVVQTVLAAVCESIRLQRADKTQHPLRSLRGYVAICVRHECIKWGKHQSTLLSQEVSLEALTDQGGQEPVAEHANPAFLLESQETLHLIWQEIRRLRPNQCAVLLLDWKEIREGVIALFVRAGVASLHEILATLPLTREQLTEPLPWSDEQIAVALGTTVNTVRTLRSKTNVHLRQHLNAVGVETARK